MKRIGGIAAATVLLGAGVALSQTPPPETSKLPPDRVAPPQDADTDITSAPDPAAAEPAPTRAPASESAETTTDSAISPPAGLAFPSDEEKHAFATCTQALRAAGAVFEPLEFLRDGEDAACGIGLPVRLEQVVPGVSLNPDTFLRCETALALSRWVTRTVLPAAEVLPERGGVVALSHGSSYICRRRNNLPDGVLSQHSFGNAIDIMGVSFADGSTLAIEPRERDGTLEEAFQDAVRAGACLEFTTVLGPGTDESHADHLHFDIKARSGGFRLCQ